jgi:hypothetical protein
LDRRGAKPTAAVPGHDRRDAVKRRGRQLRCPDRLTIVMSVNVYKAGRDELAVRIDFPRATRSNATYLRNTIPGYAYVSYERLAAGAIDDGATTDD